MFNYAQDDKAARRGHQTPASPEVQGVRLATGKAAGARVPKNAQEALALELLEEIRLLRETQTQHFAKLRGSILNGVLDAGTDIYDANGQITRSYNVACGSLVVTNHTGAAITIQAGPAGTGAPTKGRGIHLIPATSFMTIPIGTHVWTAYGTAGGTLTFQAFTGLQPYGVTV